MSLGVQVTITGGKENIVKLGKLGQQFLNFQMAMKEIGVELPNYFSNNVFASQGGAIGERWDPLKQSTKEEKAKKYPGAQPLVRTGTMKNSFEALYPNVNSVIIGNTAPQFPYHQSKAPRLKLPRRSMMSTEGNVKAIIGKIIDADIRNKIAKAGF